MARDVLAKLKADERTSHIPVVVWSGRTGLAVPLREEVLKSMVADAIPVSDAWMGLSAVIFTAIGPVLVKATLTGQSGYGFDKRCSRLKEWVSSRGPNNLETNAVLKDVPQFKPDLVFQFTLRALITGIEALRAAPAR